MKQKRDGEKKKKDSDIREIWRMRKIWVVIAGLGDAGDHQPGDQAVSKGWELLLANRQ